MPAFVIRQSRSIASLFSLGLVLFQASAAKADEPTVKPAAAPAGIAMNDAETAFRDSMTGARLTGRFTVDSKDSTPKEEAYEIVAVTKMTGRDWIIVARIKYGKNDVKVPVPVKMDWAGDTPVLSLTDIAVPPLGTFTSRVMFYDGRYAGTWQHGDKGGHLFGKYEKPAADAPDANAADPAPAQ